MKKTNETWLQYAQRVSSDYRLEDDVTDSYHHFKSQGFSDKSAAAQACYEWDIILPDYQITDVLKEVLKLII